MTWSFFSKSPFLIQFNTNTFLTIKKMYFCALKMQQSPMSESTNAKPFPTYSLPNWPELETEILAQWKDQQVFNQSISSREGAPSFTFYEGPPSANGMPGIHHVMARAIKDVFCRYKTQKGFKVLRKGGWDTHGLPVELQVEKRLNITKDDIGKKISIAEYNQTCKEDVMKFKEHWDSLTERIGFWLDLENPYVTYENQYIESVWNLLKQFHQKGLLYKGHSIQPYSPAAGTGLSSHELNQPGCYREIKDTTVVAQFLIDPAHAQRIQVPDNTCFLAWTTTPWTLPSNTALAVGAHISYLLIKTRNPYTLEPVHVILAEEAVSRYFSADTENIPLEESSQDSKKIGWKRMQTFKGSDLQGIVYRQLMPYVKPKGKAFEVLCGDFVTTEDGTGIVHIAPSFGSDDFRLAAKQGIESLTLVDTQGRFVPQVTDFAGEFVKAAFYSEEERAAKAQEQNRPQYLSVDEQIAIKLKKENKAFKVEKYEHNYPHCWRTDKPVLYYPLQSWFIKTTEIREKLIAWNQKINWKPESTGQGRFANWLENLVDWNLSRSRFWGTPLPVWRSEDGTEELCIGSLEELKSEVNKAVHAGLMKQNPLENPENIDLHRPLVDEIILVSPSGKPLKRETDLIDVWFDSGAMPYAQWNWPFQNQNEFQNNFPADFIAEGVDQTRGWFFTLHVIAVALFDSYAFKNVLSNGLVLDKDGNKMSKRLNNTIDPFKAVNTYGADAIRWYMLSNTQPWDNLKFDMNGVVDVQRKFLGTLFNTYSFFALYANVDQFTNNQKPIPVLARPELDQWILSLLHSLIQNVEQSLNDFDPTKAARAIQDFVTENLSNWYVRLSRRRFWKGEYTEDKIAAYQTLHECLLTVSKLMAPIAPFYAERLYQDLIKPNPGSAPHSVHLAHFPAVQKDYINPTLQNAMQLAQDLSSMVLSLRKKEQIKVRQPLSKLMVPVLNNHFKKQLQHIEPLLLSEVNVKELVCIDPNSPDQVLVKEIKPNFKTLGKKAGPLMKPLAQMIKELNHEHIDLLESGKNITLNPNNQPFELTPDDVEINFVDIPGWLVANEKGLTVALDITLTPQLINEGIAREWVNKIQSLRKELDFELTDKVSITYYTQHAEVIQALNEFQSYICSEVLATQLQNISSPTSLSHSVEINNQFLINVQIHKNS